MTEEEPNTTIEVFDLTIPQQYLDAMAATDTKINAQMKVWESYISELSGSNTLRKLSKQMNMLSAPLEREIESQQILLGRKK